MNSLWLDSIEKVKLFSPINDDLETDICIIGAGIFGLTCGYYLSKLGFKVTILEKDSIGEKATRTYYCKNHKSTWFIL